MKYPSVFVGGLFILAALSQAKLQTVERNKTLGLAKSTKQFTLSRLDPARRGTIYSHDMKPIAEDAQEYELNIQFNAVPHSDAFFMELSSATGIPASEFASLAESGVKQKSWLQPISEEGFVEVQNLRGRWRADGLSVAPAGLREYPLGEAASCLVGVVRHYRDLKAGTGVGGVPPVYVRRDVRTGIEGSQNKHLTGTSGLKVGLTDRFGRFLPMRMEDGGKVRKDGQRVVLTIQSDLQDYASQAVKKAVVDNKADNGTAVVMNPENGDILALANWPSFDPDGDSNGQFGFNPSYMAQLEPGSTFKILTLAKGLDCGKVHLTDTVTCQGQMHPTESSTIHCDSHHGNRAHGTINAIQAIAKSCNVSAATWAMRIGRPEMIDYIEKLGVLDRPGIGVPGEVPGLFRKNEYAKELQLATLGFGQSITCTPVALADAFTMIANDGVRIPARLIEKIGDRVIAPKAGRRIISSEAARQVRQCMEAVFDKHGTGESLNIPGYTLGGKTGTAEKVGSKGRGYVANFIGFVPAEHPKAVILVMINHPKAGKYYGATVAGPVFVAIAKSVIQLYNIPPDHNPSATSAGIPEAPATTGRISSQAISARPNR